jgi:hypothetical protein
MLLMSNALLFKCWTSKKVYLKTTQLLNYQPVRIWNTFSCLYFTITVYKFVDYNWSILRAMLSTTKVVRGPSFAGNKSHNKDVILQRWNDAVVTCVLSCQFYSSWKLRSFFWPNCPNIIPTNLIQCTSHRIPFKKQVHLPWTILEEDYTSSWGSPLRLHNFKWASFNDLTWEDKQLNLSWNQSFRKFV